MSELAELLRSARSARTFEDAADAALTWWKGRADDAVRRRREASPVAWRNARCVAVSVFLTSPTGFFGQRRGQQGRDPSPRYSDSCWRWVQRHPQGVAVEVEQASFTPLAAEGDVPAGLAADVTDTAFERSSRLYLKDASHLLSWPVLDPSGNADGLVTVELHVPGERFAFATLGAAFNDDVRAMIDLVAPLLRRLPRGELAPADLPRWAGERTRPLLTTLAVQSQVFENLLLTGSPGTGKTELARWLHRRSPRRDGPFEVVQLATLPVGLAHGHLFGWEKGAFSGATGPHAGPVERAEGGTLFLDDIHRTPPEIQDALLGLLEGRTWRKLGTESIRRANVRIIAASSVDIRRAAAEGSVSADLSSRLIFNQVRVPDLDERRDEIPAWVALFAETVHKRHALPGVVSVSPEAVAELCARTWPGNLRDLRETVVRAYAMAVASMPLEGAAGPCIEVAHLPLPETRRSTRELRDCLERAAELLLERAASPGHVLDLDDAEVLGALVLDGAVQRWGTSEGLRRVGRGSYVDARAGAALVRKLRQRLEALRRKLDL